MRYIVIAKDQTAFYTNWFDYENFWNAETIYCVVDMAEDLVTFDGVNWEDITFDHL